MTCVEKHVRVWVLNSLGVWVSFRNQSLWIHSPGVVNATTPRLPFLLKVKRNPPLLKFQTYFLILYFLSLMLSLCLHWGSCGFCLIWWLSWIGVVYSFWYDVFKCLHVSSWPMMFLLTFVWWNWCVIFWHFVDSEVSGNLMCLYGLFYCISWLTNSNYAYSCWHVYASFFRLYDLEYRFYSPISNSKSKSHTRWSFFW